MLSFLPGPLIGVIAIFLYVFFAFVLAAIFFLVMLVWLITPIPAWRRAIRNFIFKIPSVWSETIRFTMWMTTKTTWEINGLENLSKQQSYLLISNHQGFLDILVMQAVLDRYVPQLRYFMKQGLLWMPLIGQACYIMGYPFMKRYSKQYIKKHPEKGNADMETTRKTCERFAKTPITLINYVEGTRFTPEKARRKQSPYKNLLKPKAGGISFILSAMESQIDTILNVTVIYSQRKKISWTFLQGRMKSVTVYIEPIKVPPELRGNYQQNREFRIYFQNWLNQRWQEKDKLIESQKLSA
jgi:1-acyl-sn-glycerol-3-phosphate acyltransferase